MCVCVSMHVQSLTCMSVRPLPLLGTPAYFGPPVSHGARSPALSWIPDAIDMEPHKDEPILKIACSVIHLPVCPAL